MKKKSFTLIELLVVIAIIAILASMLMPALSKARAKARAITCVSTMKTLALFSHMYSNDNADFWVPISSKGIQWMNNNEFLSRYLHISNKWNYTWEKGFICPVATYAFTNGVDGRPLAHGSWAMAYEDFPAGWNTDKTTMYAYCVTRIKRPSQSAGWCEYIGWMAGKINANSVDNTGTIGGLQFRHNNQSNVACFDGSVTNVKYTGIKADPYTNWWPWISGLYN